MQVQILDFTIAMHDLRRLGFEVGKTANALWKARARINEVSNQLQHIELEVDNLERKRKSTGAIHRPDLENTRVLCEVLIGDQRRLIKKAEPIQRRLVALMMAANASADLFDARRDDLLNQPTAIPIVRCDRCQWQHRPTC